MKAWLLVLAVGCHHEAATDSGEEVAKEDGCAPLDLCDNGLDDDCNGEVDEVGCALGWRQGQADRMFLGHYLDADTTTRTVWAWGNEQGDAEAGIIGTGSLDGAGGLAVTWMDSNEGTNYGTLDVEMIQGTPVIAFGTWGGTATLVRPPMGGEEAEVLSTWVLPDDAMSWSALRALDLWSEPPATWPC